MKPLQACGYFGILVIISIVIVYGIGFISARGVGLSDETKSGELYESRYNEDSDSTNGTRGGSFFGGGSGGGGK